MLQGRHTRAAAREDDIRRESNQFRCVFAIKVAVVLAPADVELHIPANGPAQLLQGLLKRPDSGLTLAIVGGRVHEYTDTPHLLGLLRERGQRPNCRTA